MDSMKRRNDLFSFENIREGPTAQSQRQLDTAQDAPVDRSIRDGHKLNVGATANTSHSILRNFGPIQESNLGTKRNRPADFKINKGQDDASSN